MLIDGLIHVRLMIHVQFYSQIRYTGFRDKSQEERKVRFANGCREGHTEISFTSTGINVQLIFNPSPMMYHHHHQHLANYERELDFDKEHGKVSFLWCLSLTFRIDGNQSILIDGFKFFFKYCVKKFPWRIPFVSLSQIYFIDFPIPQLRRFIHFENVKLNWKTLEETCAESQSLLVPSWTVTCVEHWDFFLLWSAIACLKLLFGAIKSSTKLLHATIGETGAVKL